MAMKYALKILISIFIIWTVSLLTIFKEMQREVSDVEDQKLYEQALKRFRKAYAMRNNFTDPLSTWQLVGPPSRKFSMEEKLTAVKYSEFPLGTNGSPVDLEDNIRGHIRIMIRQGWKDYSFNQYVSDLIPINRTLLDYRDEWCKQKNYSNNLPQASVVICFYNEAWSVLLRTIDSVLQRTPAHLLKEIILFDDFSTMDHLKENLENYVRTLTKVTLIRASRRKGLIRARILGTKYATSPVVVFLDSHCECTTGWIEPLLDRIKKNSATVVSPAVGHIDPATFEFIPQTSKYLQIGGFEWDLKYIWQPLLKSRKIPSEPIKTPTISGGLFAINRDFFKKIGYFDQGYRIWGAENLELSFKTWMCGGSLEIVPCSHVGHVFRKTFPYKSAKQSHRRNALRLAEVWMDDYAKYYYQRIGGVHEDFGDVTKQKELREKLKCKSFEWYMHNVYPNMKLPDVNVAYGQIYSILDGYAVCLDVASEWVNVQTAVSARACHLQGGNQFWWYTNKGRIEHDTTCLDFVLGFVTACMCDDESQTQIWIYDAKSKQLRHKQKGKCLTVKENFGGESLELDLYKCINISTQEWTMENFNINRLSSDLQP
ncbi:unnamed protein product [Pieris macdunnoughi]|uniref:Polypeptide N-acetylgalactosaminyltransferase n=1 Tax=Pieris macdunnoughi TaxID=345717 RepID=A0A821VA45_9NEOP|nr:unnamed protein product [Pieris macdunnoughi]